MTRRLHQMDICPPARSVIMACDLFNVPVEMLEVNLFEKKNFEAEFVKINPAHTIPVLEDGDIIITDSHAILMYLSDKYGKDDSFYPKEENKRALVNQRLFYDCGILFPRLRSISYPALVEDIKIVTEKQKKDIIDAYNTVEAFLAKTKYLAGDHITIADISAVTNISALVYIIQLDTKNYPKIKAWMDDMNSQPYCQKYNIKAAAVFGELLEKALGGPFIC